MTIDGANRPARSHSRARLRLPAFAKLHRPISTDDPRCLGRLLPLDRRHAHHARLLRLVLVYSCVLAACGDAASTSDASATDTTATTVTDTATTVDDATTAEDVTTTEDAADTATTVDDTAEDSTTTVVDTATGDDTTTDDTTVDDPTTLDDTTAPGWPFDESQAWSATGAELPAGAVMVPPRGVPRAGRDPEARSPRRTARSGSARRPQ